jgi:hypothetical protein
LKFRRRMRKLTPTERGETGDLESDNPTV